MSRLSDMLGSLPCKTPFQQGRLDAESGKSPPSLPTPDSSWSDRLYNRGYLSCFTSNPKQE